MNSEPSLARYVSGKNNYSALSIQWSSEYTELIACLPKRKIKCGRFWIDCDKLSSASWTFDRKSELGREVWSLEIYFS